ncbi:MAG: hypothetical protein LBC53_08860 [Spirochaetaceae bacterium]|nr:hypothetical protein [Spirochaetaceae bacterium]
MLNKSNLQQNNLFFKQGVLHEDEHWVPRVICAASQTAVNHNAFYTYRQNRKDSIMANITSKNVFDKFIIIEDLLNLANNSPHGGGGGGSSGFAVIFYGFLYYFIRRK